MNEGNILGAMEEMGVSVPGSGILKMIGNRGRDRVNAALADAMANPSEARRILATLPASERRVVEKVLASTGGRLGVVLPAVAE